MIAPVVVLRAMGPVHSTHIDNPPTHGRSIPALSHTFVENILLPSFRKLIQEVTSERMCTNYWLTVQEKVWFGVLTAPMTIAVDLDVKQKNKQQKQHIIIYFLQRSVFMLSILGLVKQQSGIHSNKKETSDSHSIVSVDPVKMSQQK